MRVALVSVDSKIPNAALMKLAAYHRAQGDTVEIHEPLGPVPDRLYASKVFTTTEPYAYLPDGCEVVLGGYGYDPSARLPQGLDAIYPAYDLFGCDYALGRITRGCPRSCDWCIVPGMDGHRVTQVAELRDFTRDQDRVRLLDDNLTARPDLFAETCRQAVDLGVAVSFEALDVRLLTDETARALASVRRWGRVHFAWDDPATEPEIRAGIARLKAAGFPLREASFYVLVGFGTTQGEDLYRLELLEHLGVETFVMPYDRTDPYQRRIARWANAKQIYRSVPFDRYDASITNARRAPADLDPLF